MTRCLSTDPGPYFGTRRRRQRLRPSRPGRLAGHPPGPAAVTDRRAGEQVDLLFAFRARKVSSSYINNTVIPMLCRKAGVPAAGVRGHITSHRARSTIASLPRKRVLLTD